MSAPQGPIQIWFRDFGSDQVIPMAFAPGETQDDIVTAARTMIDEAKAREVRVIDTANGNAELWGASWKLVPNQLGG